MKSVGIGLLIIGSLIVVAALSATGDAWSMLYTGLAVASVGGFLVAQRRRSRR
jgi:hypothetical protein